jgi:hypothetical protein
MKTHQCQQCGKFSKYVELDSYIPFGCYDPSNPEPYDPVMLCKICSNILYEEYKRKFNSGYRGGDWQKSNAEMKAAKECGLIWVNQSGSIIDGRRVSYQYIKSDS